jgi:hypothetical protein
MAGKKEVLCVLLTYGGQVVQDCCASGCCLTLADYNIQEHATVHLILRLLSGNKQQRGCDRESLRVIFQMPSGCERCDCRQLIIPSLPSEGAQGWNVGRKAVKRQAYRVFNVTRVAE